jgi:proline iminopeptidase
VRDAAPIGRTKDAASNHPKGDYVTVNGARLWYESEGTGEPLILISGGPGISHDYFHPYFSALRDSYRIIYFDGFGRGKSDRAKDRREYTLAHDVEDVEGLGKVLGLGKVNLLGHSYGGIVAQAYALRFPDSLRRLILVDTLFSSEMWQANNDNSNAELRNHFPETWEKIQQVRAQGFNTCSKEYQDANDVSPAFLMFYNASNFDKIMRGGRLSEQRCLLCDHWRRCRLSGFRRHGQVRLPARPEKTHHAITHSCRPL